MWASLRATREVGVLPIVEPPDDLEARILDAVAGMLQTRIPLHKRVLRGLAWAGSHAMRPQLAMAALFFLVIGSKKSAAIAEGASQPAGADPCRGGDHGAASRSAPKSSIDGRPRA